MTNIKSSNYQEIQPERDVSGDNFSKGQINLNWTMDSASYFNPFRSFLKIRFKLYKRVGSANVDLKRSDKIAPSMFMPDNIFQQIRMNINNQSVSEITDYVPQVSSLKQRMSMSEEQLNNYLKQLTYPQAYLEERITDLTNNTSYTDKFEYQIYENQAGNVSIAAATGTLVLSTANTILSVGDTVRADFVEYHVLAKADDSNYTVFPRPVANILTVDDGVWSFWRKRKTVNETKTRDTNVFECIWKPSIAFFDVDEFIPGCGGLFNLQLTPHPDGVYQKLAVETDISGGVVHGSTTAAAATYVFVIDSINMYLLKGMGSPISSKQFGLNLVETRCQSQNLTTVSLHQKTFQVNSKTRAITLAYQYAGAGISTNQFIASKFRCNGNDELKLTRFWINFNNKQLPSPIPDILFDKTTASSKTDYMTQRYVESIMYANSIDSPEPLMKWFERGPYYHFSGYDPESSDDRVMVSSQFSGVDFTGSIKPNILIFDHFLKKVNLNIENSMIKDVSVS